MIILGVVVVGAGFYYYFGIYKGIKGSSSISLASPSPKTSTTISAATSSSTKANSNDSNSSTSQPTNQTTPTRSGEFGPVTGKECVPHVSFNYPDNYGLNIYDNTPSSAGYASIRTNDYEIAVYAPEWTSTGNWETPCVSFSSIEDAFSQVSHSEAVAGPNYLTINGYQAVKWSNSSSKFVVLKNGDQYIEVITLSGTPDTDSNLVVHSMKFL